MPVRMIGRLAAACDAAGNAGIPRVERQLELRDGKGFCDCDTMLRTLVIGAARLAHGRAHSEAAGRARMLLAYREDPSFFAVAHALGVHHQTVQRCVERALARLNGSAKRGRNSWP
jgi:hypothetical protein